jgi:hypothetical protein
MRTMSIVFVIVSATVAAGAVQKEAPPAKGVKRGDTIAVRGCLTGGTLEATDLGSVDATGALSSGVTFRLTGDKALLKQLRDEHDGRVVDVKGVLKSELPKESVASRNVGKMKVTIGAPAVNPVSPQAQTQRSLPVLEVKSFNGSTTSCL